MLTSFDNQMMSYALRLAAKGLYTAKPNPCVGCVVVSKSEIIGEGWHHRAGEPHAEVNALREAGECASGSTVYVTLEPCSHHGRTPPCADALIDADVARVVYAMEDPNPEVSGAGLEKLRSAGIEVMGPLLELQAESLNKGFVKRQRRGLPWVTVKLAMSLDGRTAMASGESQWITGAEARSDVQRLRACSGAVIAGVGSVLQDNPSMTVRADELGLDSSLSEEIAQHQPLRVIVDSQLRTPASAKIFSQPGLVIMAAAKEGELANAEVIYLPKGERVDLETLLKELALRDCNSVLIESGAELAGAFIEEGLVDELVIYMAAKLLGSDGRPLLELPFHKMSQQLPLKITDLRSVGDDWRITATLQN